MTEEQLAEWERLANEATEGPWKFKRGSVVAIANNKDKRFIAASREAVPALIAEVRELRAELDKERKYADDNCMIGVFHGTSMANDKIRQLDKEADWLAEKCAMLDDGLSGTDAKGYREIAREVVRND